MSCAQTTTTTTRPELWWSSGLRTALGYRFELRVPRERDFVACFSRLLQDLPASSEDAVRGELFELRPYHDESRTYGLYLGERCVGAGETASDFTKAWAWNLNRNTIAAATREHVVLHAACVVRDGVTVVLPAEMESGKTTTAAGLLRAGFDYVTDEATALLPGTRQVRPFPKPLSLDPGSWPLFPELTAHHSADRSQWQVLPGSLGAAARTDLIAPPRIVVFPAYAEGVRTRLEECSPGEAAMLLCGATFAFAAAPRRAMDTLARVAADARCLRLMIGDLESAVSAVDELVSTALEDQ